MDKVSLEMICEMPKFRTGLEQFVTDLGYKISPGGEIMVLVDARMGTALRYLETQEKTKPLLIITDNTCIMYHQSLLAYQPNGILTGDLYLQAALFFGYKITF